MNFSGIPIADVVLANWAGLRAGLRLLETSVIAYRHTVWVIPRSSPRNRYACLVLATFAEGDATTYLLAPIYKCGNKGRWGASDIECGDSLHPPLPDYQFYPSPPAIGELRDFTAQIGFFFDGSDTELIESFGFEPT
ncbi:hypothetical protein [Massilia genomosp. 1]|uniref:Uncharacterized protein n=1 Tax=Massilia genomosp. 1 TaxID=2609280 RepID=A0ABX0MPT3_9BURK|nr:hypothetical protein [Massilia genomosp. 1]NHZ64771.1 hypothetical protein [Massilia genomosp. 1]